MSGLNNTFTLYGVLLGSEDYYALAISRSTWRTEQVVEMDINRADTQLITSTFME
ncbi:hypothetical protein ACLB1Q_26075 [Escherichia coli]